MGSQNNRVQPDNKQTDVDRKYDRFIKGKVVVVGGVACGKTCFCLRALKHQFDYAHMPTTEAIITPGDFTVIADPQRSGEKDATVLLEVWDLPSRDVVDMTKLHFEGAGAVIIMHDLSLGASMREAEEWSEKTDNIFPRGIQKILVGTKVDMITEDEEESMHIHLDKFCKEHKFVAWMNTSSKYDVNVSKITKLLARGFRYEWNYDRLLQIPQP